MFRCRIVAGDERLQFPDRRVIGHQLPGHFHSIGITGGQQFPDALSDTLVHQRMA